MWEPHFQDHMDMPLTSKVLQGLDGTQRTKCDRYSKGCSNSQNKNEGNQVAGGTQVELACYCCYIFFVGINHFMRDTVKNCRRDRFVQTMLGRHRYLPGIKDSKLYHKADVC